jgi:hypothetical protein
MLITSDCVAGTPSCRTAEVPSRRVAPVASRRLAGFGPGAVVRARGLAGPAAEAGNWRGGDTAMAGYLPGLEGSVQLGQAANQAGRTQIGEIQASKIQASKIQASKIQASKIQASKIQASTATKSTVQNGTDQHNTMTRLVPAFWGEVGPHPAREPWPA